MHERVLNSLIHIYKSIDESKMILEDVINQVGLEHAKNPQPLPQDIQQLIEMAMELTPEQRKSLMRFIESLKQE